MKNFEQDLYNFILIFISLSIFYLFKNFLPKYFETKASNQATKEDIGEITEIIENIKSDLFQQTEFLKAQLSLTNQHKLNIKSAEREAMFDFNKQKSVWIYSLIRFSFYKYNFETYKEVGLEYLENQKRQYEYDLAAAHLVLFIHDSEFMELKEKLVNEVIELQKIVSDTIYSLYEAFWKAETNLNLEKDDQIRQDIRYNFNEELLVIVDEHNKKALKQFEEVNRLDIQMRELLFKRIKILDDCKST
ncbi:hypothetical protein [Flavobacterium sp. CAU 1735]|uniref:hypothetical protein n=1 Tax=Flavobacterium sp. CAU 1735 TaxID=3140361 RepID=UPI00326002CD